MELRLSAHLGALSLCAKIWQRVAKPRNYDTPVPMDDHILQDIGLSRAEAERLHLTLPSQSVRHPYL